LNAGENQFSTSSNVLRAALICDSVLLGGGNAKLMENLPSHVALGANSNASMAASTLAGYFPSRQQQSRDTGEDRESVTKVG